MVSFGQVFQDDFIFRGLGDRGDHFVRLCDNRAALTRCPIRGEASWRGALFECLRLNHGEVTYTIYGSYKITENFQVPSGRR